MVVQQRRIAILAANCDDDDEGDPEDEVDVLYDVMMLGCCEACALIAQMVSC